VSRVSYDNRVVKKKGENSGGKWREQKVLRGLLIPAALQLVETMGPTPGQKGVAAFLHHYLGRKSVANIAQELGVSREWCSRNYRRESLRLAGMQFVAYISKDRKI